MQNPVFIFYADVRIFEKISHLWRGDFDSFHALCEVELGNSMDVRNGRGDLNYQRVSRNRKLSTSEMLLFFLDILSGGNEWWQVLERLSFSTGFSIGTASNYFRHALFVLNASLLNSFPNIISWTSRDDRKESDGFINGFPKCVFNDGNKNKRWRSGDNY